MSWITRRFNGCKWLAVPLAVVLLASNAYAVDCGVIVGNTVLDQNLDSSETCITFGANGITLDCAGYYIAGNKTALSYGVYSAYNDSVVKNCTISAYLYAIQFNGVVDSTIYNNTVWNSTIGIKLISSLYTNVSHNNVSYTTQYGIDLNDYTNYSNIHNNIVFKTGANSGIGTNGYGATYNNIYENNVSYGIGGVLIGDFADFNVVYDNQFVYSTTYEGITVWGNNNTFIRNNASYATASHGVYIGDFGLGQPSGLYNTFLSETYLGNGDDAINSEVGGYNRFWNVTFQKNNVSVIGGNFTVEYPVRVNVTNTAGVGIAWANVNVYDKSTALVVSTSTLATGLTPVFNATEFFYDVGGADNHTPHNFTASRVGYNDGYTVYFIEQDESNTVHVTLGGGGSGGLGDLLGHSGNVYSGGAPLITGNVNIKLSHDACITWFYDSGSDFNGSIGSGQFDLMLGNASLTVLNIDPTRRYLYINQAINGASQVWNNVGGICRQFSNPFYMNNATIDQRIDVWNTTNYVQWNNNTYYNTTADGVYVYDAGGHQLSFNASAFNATYYTQWSNSSGGAGETHNGTFNETDGTWLYNATPFNVSLNITAVNNSLYVQWNNNTYYNTTADGVYVYDVGGHQLSFNATDFNATYYTQWSNSSATPGGVNTSVQFNDGGVFGGSSNLTWNNTYNRLFISGNGSYGEVLVINGTHGATNFTGNDITFNRGFPNYITAMHSTGSLLLGAGGTKGALYLQYNALANTLYLNNIGVGVKRSNPRVALDVNGSINASINVTAPEYCFHTGTCFNASNFTTSSTSAYYSDEWWINRETINASNYNFTFNTTPLTTDYYNKTEVDALHDSATFSFYFTNHSSDVAPYLNLTVGEHFFDPQVQITETINNDGDLLAEFLTEVNEPQFNLLRAGLYNAHVHLNATTAGDKSVVVYWELEERYSNGTEVHILNSSETDYVDFGGDHHDIHGSLGDDRVLSETGSRLVVSFYANLYGVGGVPDLTMNVEGLSASRFSILIDSSVFEDVYLELDGSNANQNIDVGAFNFTASYCKGLYNWTTNVSYLAFNGSNLYFDFDTWNASYYTQWNNISYTNQTADGVYVYLDDDTYKFNATAFNATYYTQWSNSSGGAGETHNGTFNETDGVYLYNSTAFQVDLNETKLNETIDARAVGTPIARSVHYPFVQLISTASLYSSVLNANVTATLPRTTTFLGTKPLYVPRSVNFSLLNQDFLFGVFYEVNLTGINQDGNDIYDYWSGNLAGGGGPPSRVTFGTDNAYAIAYNVTFNFTSLGLLPAVLASAGRGDWIGLPHFPLTSVYKVIAGGLNAEEIITTNLTAGTVFLNSTFNNVSRTYWYVS